MTSSNPSSCSPPRTASRPQQANPPGVLAISSAMLANASQSQGGQTATHSKRSKSGSQRRVDNASSPSLFDPSLAADSPAISRPDRRPAPASAFRAAVPAEDSGDVTASTLDSPSKRPRSRRRAKAVQSPCQADEGTDMSAVEGSGTSGIAARPRQSRGLSSATFALPMKQDSNHSMHPSGTADPFALSKSAPASSFLGNFQQSRQRRDHSSLRKEDNGSVHHPNIRSSNSADEWEMPSGRLLTGNDSLTWQQQAALSRKSSQQSKKLSKSKAPAGVNQLTKQTSASVLREPAADGANARSGLSNVMAAGAAAEQKASQSALTWQQALLQRSAPATPSAGNIFEALEDGYSGARPASDHSRARSSPVKNNRPVTRSQQQSNVVTSKPALANEKDVDLDKQLKDLVFSSVKPAMPTQPKSAKKTTPIAMQASSPAERANTDLFNASTAPPALNANASPAAAKPISMSANSASPTKSALYAGPKFHNSPHATQLPTPRLAALMNRNRDTSPVPQSPSTNEPIFA